MIQQMGDKQTTPGPRRRAGGRIRGCGALLGLLPLLLLAAGCGAGAAGPLPPTTDTALPAPPVLAASPTLPAPPSPARAPTAAAAVPATPAAAVTGETPVIKAYAHSPDYAQIAGQVHLQGSCWVVTYVSPLVDVAPDQYNNQLALVPSSAWDSATLKDGQWLVVHGRPAAVNAESRRLGCTATGYEVTALQVIPNAP